MPKVITFSRVFPSYHPRRGEPTYFVEKIHNSVFDDLGAIPSDLYFQLNLQEIQGAKHHTIRAGKRWKVGDKFSPRVWSDVPYKSKQITIAPDIEIVKVWDIEISKFQDGYWIDFGSYHLSEHMVLDYTILQMVAKNDGLKTNELLDWFQYPKFFSGQIICWNPNINY